jgi:hypothetical protein
MPRYDDEHDERGWGDDEPEGPQERDLGADEDDETETVPCPNCRRAIAEFAERCPHCGDWVTPGNVAVRRPTWFWVALVAALAVMLAWILF